MQHLFLRSSSFQKYPVIFLFTITLLIFEVAAHAQIEQQNLEMPLKSATYQSTDTTSPASSWFAKAASVTLTTLQLGLVGLKHTAAFVVQATSSVYHSVTHWWGSEPAPKAEHIVRHLNREGGTPFNQLVAATGYEFSKIKIGSGIIPTLAFGFEHAHHISEAQEAELRQQLELHKQQYPDLLSVVERQIIYMLLDTIDLDRKTFDLVEVTVTVLPWPGVDVVFNPQGVNDPTTEDVLEKEQETFEKQKVILKKENAELSDLKLKVNQLQKTIVYLQQELTELRQPKPIPMTQPSP